MRIIVVLLMATLSSGAGWCGFDGVFNAGGVTAPGLRTSDNYIIVDSLGQFVVGESKADPSYSCGWIEHGVWHSEIRIPPIGEIKGESDYSYVSAYAKIVTAGTDRLYRTFYIEEQNRTSGIRVSMGSNPLVISAGDMVDVSGLIKTSSRERYIDFPEIAVRFQDVMQIEPFFSSARWLGGTGTDVFMSGGAGLNNLGLLVRTSGRVTYVDTATPARFFYVDDGSGLWDGTMAAGLPVAGIRVWIANLATGNVISPPGVGEYVSVTGVCAAYSASAKVYAQVRPRAQEDVQVTAEE